MIILRKGAFSILALMLFFGFDIEAIEAKENFIVKIGQNKIFTAYNVQRTGGTATSNGRTALAKVEVDPYQSGISEAWAGVKFTVEEGANGETVSDATISITFSYKLNVDFNVLPPNEGGGGSADARIYCWITNYKKEFDFINFIHNSGNDEKSGTKTFTHTLSKAPLWTHLYAGQSYEITADVYTHAEVFKDYKALSLAEVTVQEIRVDFGCVPKILVSPDLIKFKSIPSPTPDIRPVYVKNTGKCDLKINDIDINGPDNFTVETKKIQEKIPAQFSTGFCRAGTTLGTNDQCIIIVGFRANDKSSSVYGQLIIETDALDTPKSIVLLEGKGIPVPECVREKSFNVAPLLEAICQENPNYPVCTPCPPNPGAINLLLNGKPTE